MTTLNDYFRSYVDWELARLKLSGSALKSIARDVLIPHDTDFLPAWRFLEEVVVPSISYRGQIAEVWEYELAVKVHTVARSLSPSIGAALLVTNDCADCDLDAWRREADEATAEAYRLLYGDPEEW